MALGYSVGCASSLPPMVVQATQIDQYGPSGSVALRHQCGLRWHPIPQACSQLLVVTRATGIITDRNCSRALDPAKAFGSIEGLDLLHIAPAGAHISLSSLPDHLQFASLHTESTTLLFLCSHVSTHTHLFIAVVPACPGCRALGRQVQLQVVTKL